MTSEYNVCMEHIILQLLTREIDTQYSLQRVEQPNTRECAFGHNCKFPVRFILEYE